METYNKVDATNEQGKKQVDGPDEPVVNTEEQNKAVNPEDGKEQAATDNIDSKKGNSTGDEKKDTDTKK